MATQHAFGYSRSVRAKCHGPSPCKGTAFPVGTLRYGQMTSSPYGENVEWRHWGCVTPEILQRLAAVNLDQIPGFKELNAVDQTKIHLAIQLRRIDVADIPDSAKPKRPPGVSLSQTSHNKRKAIEESPQASTSRATVTQPLVDPQTEAIEEGSQENEIVDELYCTMRTNVVGIQYYEGLVAPGEEVVLTRDPRNPYDSNAIQVKNIGQVQVGHIPRNVASKLAPLLDRKLVTVEGVINNGNLGQSRIYTLSMTLKIYGAADKRSILEPQLVWATPGQRGFPSRNNGTTSSRPAGKSYASGGEASSSLLAGCSSSNITAVGYPYGSSGVAQTPSISTTQREATRKQQEAVLKQQEALRKAAELKQMIDGLEKVDDDGRRSSLLDNICSTEDILSLPLHPDPPGIKKGNLKVDLLKHQSQALQWCIEREHPVLPVTESDKPVQFWQYKTVNGKQPYYFNLATKTPQSLPPVLGRGALCADAMGLGKTLTMIALVLTTKGDESAGTSKTTLIVSPLSILSNWEKQIEDHCVPGALSACVYYGSNRKSSLQDLQKYDIVITTYQTISSEYGSLDVEGGRKKRKTERALFEIHWKRVILDEGHNIRNPKTKMAQSVCALKAERRWVLSGTPIINSPRDLGSLLTFLQICRPLDDEAFFKRLLLRPLKDALPSGVELLSALMNQICIRRTKEMQDNHGNPLIPLPPVEMIKVPVSLHDEARRLYDQVEQLSRQRFENYMNSQVNTTFAQSNVLGMLTRMRQLALHPGLLPSNYLEELRKTDDDGAADSISPLTPTEKLRLQDILAKAVEDCEECPICFDILNSPRITYCSHKFCLACIIEVISRDPKCPMDRRPISMNDLLEPSPPTELTQKPGRDNNTEGAVGVYAGSSAKIDQLVHLLQLTPLLEKSLVFSQFTSFLDKIGEALDEAGIPYVRFDGQMSARRRQEAIARFSVPVKDRRSSHSSSQVARATRSRGKKDRAERPDSHDFDNDDDGDADFVLQDCEMESFDTEEENPRVMLISLKAGALGLNLTVANNVFLMDPWWQEGIESQAIDRVNRIGQEKPVHVYQLIAEDTVESKVLEIQERKKKLVQQAFSGIKRRETQREQREARLQDLVELFGMRRQNANQGGD